MYEIIKSINETTLLAMRDGKIFVLKKIMPEDTELYKKLCAINNINVAKIYETVLIENDFYAVEEFIQGVTLDEFFNSHGLFSDEEIKPLILQLCNGLEAVHSLGIIHRDINPNNIMVDEKGSLKIIDFGISRIRKLKQSADTQLLGTHGFAPPEQYGFSQTGFEADIYSIGVLMNYLKTGCFPSEKTDSGAFAPVIVKCTQMDKNNRYKSVVELAADISKKDRIKKYIRKIPGFRRDIWWHKLIALVYYFAVVFLFCCSCYESDIKTALLYLCVTVFMFIIPVPILLNAGGWLEKWSFTRNKTKSSKIFFQLFLANLSMILSLVFILLS